MTGRVQLPSNTYDVNRSSLDSIPAAAGSRHVPCRGAHRRSRWPRGLSGGVGQGAQELIDAFLVAAAAAGVAPEPWPATLYTGQAVKTDERGWYLRRNQSVAVGEDGGYYVHGARRSEGAAAWSAQG